MDAYKEAQYKSAVIDGQLAYSLLVFGDHIADREGYKELKGMDAVLYYLMMKHHWLPSVVKSMSIDDLQFCLSEEMSGWVMPPEARP